MRLMQFHFKKVNHVPGKELHTEAALSRMRGDTQVTVPQKEMNIYTDGKLDTLPVSDFRLAEIKETQHEDPVCKEKDLLHRRLARQVLPPLSIKLY